MRILYYKPFYFLLLQVIAFSSYAQHQNDNWYFGNKAAIGFSGSTSIPSVLYNNPMQTRASACISDEKTGQLLFYTNGLFVWNKNHVRMSNAMNISSSVAKGVLIVPYPGIKTKYLIFTIDVNNNLCYSMVDMQLNGGLGELTFKNLLISANIASAITAVKNASSNSYWLITHGVNNNSFFIYSITVSGVQPIPTETKTGQSGINFGDLVSNNAGNKIAITHYTDASGAFAQVFTFDKFCGKIENPTTLYKDPNWDYAYGIAFSPDDNKLYIAYSYLESQVVQYSGANYSTWGIAATDNQNLNHLMLGPDDKLYITTHDNSIPSPIIDVIEFPNNPVATVGYKKDAIDLGIGRNSNFEFPNFLTDKSIPQQGPDNSIGILEANTCLGDSTKFAIYNNHIPDSVRWDFGDPNSTAQNNTSTLTNPAHAFTQTGTYWVTLNWYRCGLEIFMSKKIKIIAAGGISLGADTSVCYGDTVILNPNTAGTKHLWNTGDTTATLTVTKAGVYWVKIENGLCSGVDTIVVKKYPPLWVEIGDVYTICDDSTELLRLDAGKGYEHYKWTPTGDTSQWIIINKVGDYFVVVKDNKGCKANDGAKVKRQCDFTFYMPTAFTPNNDSKNDVFAPVHSDVTDFRIEIFDRWGEKVFETTDINKGWNGTYNDNSAPIGVYTWQLSFKGYHNKLLRNYNYKGVVHLIR